MRDAGTRPKRERRSRPGAGGRLQHGFRKSEGIRRRICANRSATYGIADKEGRAQVSERDGAEACGRRLGTRRLALDRRRRPLDQPPGRPAGDDPATWRRTQEAAGAAVTLAPMAIHPEATIEPGAHVSIDAEIGRGAFVGAGATVMAGAVVGARCHVIGTTTVIQTERAPRGGLPGRERLHRGARARRRGHSAARGEPPAHGG